MAPDTDNVVDGATQSKNGTKCGKRAAAGARKRT